MTEIYLLIAILFPLAVIVRFLMGKLRAIEFPLLAAVAFAGWALPQFIALYFSEDLAFKMLDRSLLMSLLCLGAACFGYRLAKKPWSRLQIDLHPDRLESSTFALFLVAFTFYILLSQLPVEVRSKTQWEGLPVAYLFFSKNIGTCLIIVFFLSHEFSMKFTKKMKIIFLTGIFYYFDSVILMARRAETLDLIFFILCYLWFRKKVQPSRLLITTIGLALILFFTAIGQYRSAVVRYSGERDWSAVYNIDFVGSFQQIFQTGGVGGEMKNCTILIDSIDRHSSFDYGLFHFNSLIQSFVPRQLIGQKIKQSLSIDFGNPVDLAYSDRGFVPITGATIGGMTDAFGSFWYFGCLEFLLIGWLMGKIYIGAMQGWLAQQVAYTILLTPALHTITHSTHNIVSKIIHSLIFLGPILWYSRMRRRSDILSGPGRDIGLKGGLHG